MIVCRIASAASRKRRRYDPRVELGGGKTPFKTPAENFWHSFSRSAKRDRAACCQHSSTAAAKVMEQNAYLEI
jgi:hypothetical protein